MARAAPARLEIAANSLASALAAQDGGADRIELCTALEVGGLTPSHALIALARERVRLPIYVLIRPRPGDFVYADAELDVMARDIETCVALGCDGIVLGALDCGGGVDVTACRRLIAAGGKLGVTFHRAFDMAADLPRALEDVIALGCERLLTSGGAASALTGAARIRDLSVQAAGRISVMPGAGIDASNITSIRAATDAREFHASAKRLLPSRQRVIGGRPPDMARGEWRTDADQVRALVAQLRHP
jgi:copper homeostasis protein